MQLRWNDEKLLESASYKILRKRKEKVNSLISLKEIEFVIKSLPTKKTRDPDSLLINFIKHLGKKKNSNPTQNLSENKEGRHTSQPIL